MKNSLENFKPKLRAGRVIPQGSRIIFETDDPYNQVVLPMALADLILLCGGQYSVREIIEKIYKKQGSVPFKSVLSTLHLLHQGGFLENGQELQLGNHLESWMQPRQAKWFLSWRFGQRIVASSKWPVFFYLLTLSSIIGAFFGLQYFPAEPFSRLDGWVRSTPFWFLATSYFFASSILQSFRHLMGGLQTLLLTGKAYNVSLTLDGWGAHLQVGEEALDLFENRLYRCLYHVSQILMSWLFVLALSVFVEPYELEPFIFLALFISAWELNPFIASEGRLLIQSLLIPSDREVVSWHFSSSLLVASLTPQGRRQDEDFAKVCAIWGGIWLTGAFLFMLKLAIQFAPTLLTDILKFNQASLSALAGALGWLILVYVGVQFFVEKIVHPLTAPLRLSFKKKVERWTAKVDSSWDLSLLASELESLPLFSHFSEEVLKELLDECEVLAFNENEFIAQQNDRARDLFVLWRGEVEMFRQDQEKGISYHTQLSAPSVFGETALIDDQGYPYHIRAKIRSVILRVPVAKLKHLVDDLKHVKHFEAFKNAIMVNQFFVSSPVFRSLSQSSINFLSSRGAIEYYDQQQSVFHQGDPGDSLYLILKGKVEVFVHETSVKVLEQGNFFGEIALLANIPRTGTVVSIEPSVLFRVSSDSFWEILVQHMDLGIFIESISEARLKEDLEILPRQKPRHSA